jgi:hypothetical protein
MTTIREKVDRVIFSDVFAVIFACYVAIIFVIDICMMIAMGFGYPVWDLPYYRIFVVSTIPFLLGSFYYLWCSRM